MLSSVLNSKRAIAVNIRIIRVFTKMREILADNLNLKLEIEGIKKKLNSHSKNIELVFSYLDEFLDKKKNHTFLEDGFEKPLKGAVNDAIENLIIMK